VQPTVQGGALSGGEGRLRGACRQGPSRGNRFFCGDFCNIFKWISLALLASARTDDGHLSGSDSCRAGHLLQVLKTQTKTWNRLGGAGCCEIRGAKRGRVSVECSGRGERRMQLFSETHWWFFSCCQYEFRRKRTFVWTIKCVHS